VGVGPAGGPAAGGYRRKAGPVGSAGALVDPSSPAVPGESCRRKSSAFCGRAAMPSTILP